MKIRDKDAGPKYLSVAFNLIIHLAKTNFCSYRKLSCLELR